MLKKHKNIKNFFKMVLICSFYSGNIIFATEGIEPNQELKLELNPESTLESNREQLSDLCKDAREQLKKIDFALEKLAQAIHSGHVKVKEKDRAKDYIEKTRGFIDKTLNNTFIEYFRLININNALIKDIDIVINNDFIYSEFYLLDKTGVLSRKLDRSAAECLLELNEKELDNLVSKFKTIGVNRLNGFARSTEKLVKNNIITKKVKTALKRSLPYLGLASYLFYINKKATVERIPVIGEFLSKIKVKLGTNPDNKDKREIEGDAKLPTIKEMDHNENGYLSDIHKHIQNIFSLDVKPIVTLSVGTIMAPIIKKDIEDFAGWSYERFEDALAIFKGEAVKDRSAVKKSKLMFDDIAGYSATKKELNNIVNYFKNKDLFDLVGQTMPSCYLVSGRIDISGELVQALTGEINKVISAKDSNKFCGIYNITAAELVGKKVKDIISKIEESNAEYCVILLQQLDWLYAHASNKVKVWSKLSELLRTIKGKKQISIFATIKNIHLLDKPMCAFFDGLIKVNKPDETDLKEFITKSLKDRCINIANFDLDILAQKAKNLSLTELKLVLNRAYTSAYLNSRILLQSDIEQAISEF